MESGHLHSTERSRPWRRLVQSFLQAVMLTFVPVTGFADESPPRQYFRTPDAAAPLPREETANPMRMDRPWVLGIRRFQMDGGPQLVGWKLSDHWYLGRQRSEGSTLALVWQKDRTRFSLAPDGVRVTKSF
jgi:hypothetical protein